MDIFEDKQFEIKKIEKGTLLLSKGSVCKFAYKVLNGYLKNYPCQL